MQRTTLEKSLAAPNRLQSLPSRLLIFLISARPHDIFHIITYYVAFFEGRSRWQRQDSGHELPWNPSKKQSELQSP